MDEASAELVDEAWQMFGGSEPAPPAVDGLVRLAALEMARGELGEAEAPPGSNHNPYGVWYGMDGQPWCAMFVTWAYELGADELGADSPAFVRGSRYAYVPYIVGDARAGRYGLSTTDDPIPGDVVCFDWELNGEHDHVGLFERWTSGTSTSTRSRGTRRRAPTRTADK